MAYDKAQHYYYLTQRAPGYTLTAKDATATIKVGGVDTKVDPNDEIYEGTPVTLTQTQPRWTEVRRLDRDRDLERRCTE